MGWWTVVVEGGEGWVGLQLGGDWVVIGWLGGWACRARGGCWEVVGWIRWVIVGG